MLTSFRLQVTLLMRPHGDGTQKEYKLLRQKLSVNPVQYQLCGKPLPLPKTKGAASPPPSAPSPAPSPAASPEAAAAADGSVPLPALPVEAKEGPDAGTNPVNTGYIKVATFSKQTADAVKTAIKALQSQGATRYCTSHLFSPRPTLTLSDSSCAACMHPILIPRAMPFLHGRSTKGDQPQSKAPCCRLSLPLR